MDFILYDFLENGATDESKKLYGGIYAKNLLALKCFKIIDDIQMRQLV